MKAKTKLQTLLTVIAMMALFPCLKAQADDETANIFSQPVAQANQVPGFVDGSGKPLSAKSDPTRPTWDQIRALPSLTGDQRKNLDEIQKQSKLDVQPLQEQLKTLQAQLKGSKSEQNVSANPMSDSMDAQADGQGASLNPVYDLTARTNSLKTQIQTVNDNAWQSAINLLSKQQLKEIDLMRQGKLIIGESQANNAPENNPKKSSGNLERQLKSQAPAMTNLGLNVLRQVISGLVRGY